jgi:ADP-ribose pyrophosphatase YjhB (NUDIX family)
MNVSNELREFILQGYKHYLPHVAVDCIVFGFHDNQLKVLLLKIKNADQWSLPGGFIKWAEPANEAAQRVLQERTGISQVFLQQFYTFSTPDRNKVPKLKDLVDSLNVELVKDNWFFQRIITIGYYALVEFSKVNPTTDMFSDAYCWWDMDKLPMLLFDHKQIIEQALKTLRMQLNFHPVGYNLLPEKFTMPELQKLYETILDRPLDRRNFQKKMLGLGFLERLEERKHVGPHKSPYYYRFDTNKYEQALQGGISFGF